MSVLFCDTDCELWFSTARELDIKVIGMPYAVDGEETLYDLGEHTDFKAFYDKMRSGCAPITSGLNEAVYTEIFEPYFKNGEDILYVAFSSQMSSTFKYLDLCVSALKEKYPTVKFRRFDTRNISMGAGIMVYMAAKFFRAHSCDADATYAYLESIADNVATYFVVDDLKYLARGGRLTPAKAKMGNLMQIKPVLNVDAAGNIDVFTKQNGSKKAIHFMLDMFESKYKNIDDAPVIVVNADCEAAANDVAATLKQRHPELCVWQQPVGPVIGAHCGPGTIGLIYTSKER